MMTIFQVPKSLQLHINVTHGTGTRPAWIKMFQWALDTYPFQQVREHIHDAMIRGGLILRYRTFIRDYHLEVLRPEHTPTPPAVCFPFFCTGKS